MIQLSLLIGLIELVVTFQVHHWSSSSLFMGGLFSNLGQFDSVKHVSLFEMSQTFLSLTLSLSLSQSQIISCQNIRITFKTNIKLFRNFMPLRSILILCVLMHKNHTCISRHDCFVHVWFGFMAYQPL